MFKRSFDPDKPGKLSISDAMLSRTNPDELKRTVILTDEGLKHAMNEAQERVEAGLDLPLSAIMELEQAFTRMLELDLALHVLGEEA